MTVDLQPTDYAVTLAAWRERNRGKWRGMVEVRDCDVALRLYQARYHEFIAHPIESRALYLAIQAEGRR